MRTLLRGIGWILIMVAGGIAMSELVGFVRTGDRHIASIEELWRLVDSTGLNASQASVERFMGSSAWDAVRPFLVSAPALVVPLALGLLFVFAARIGGGDEEASPVRRGRRRRSRNSLLN